MQSDKVLNLPAGYFGIVFGDDRDGICLALCQPGLAGQPLVRGWASDSGDDHLGIID